MKENEKQPFLYHFMPIHKFIDFALNRTLILTSLSYMEDKLDGISSEDASNLYRLNHQQNLLDQDDFFRRISFGVPNVNIIFDNINDFRKHSLCCCFYYPQKTEESIAMWKLYAQKDSIALRIPKKELETFISNNTFNHYPVLENGEKDAKLNSSPIFSQREVEYINFFSDFTDNIVPQGFIKHEDYSFENEYRLLLVNDVSEEKFWYDTVDEIKKDCKNPNEPKIRAELNKFISLAKSTNPKIYKIELTSELLSKSLIVSSPFIDLWKLKNLKSINKELGFNINFQYSRSLPKVVINSFNFNA